jgi:hypothetical protein
MISITITGTADEIHSDLRALLSGEAAERPVELLVKGEPEKPKATRSTKAKTEPAKQGTAASSAPDITQEDTSTTSDNGPTATTDAPPSDSEPLDPVELKKRGFRYAQKAGAPAASELIIHAGAENGKFEELDEAGLARLSAALDELGY